jgi:putative salt-induced outer membrane protein
MSSFVTLRSRLAGSALLVLGVAAAFPGVLRADDPPKPPPIWSGKAEASYVATSGNSDAKTLGAGGEVVYAPAPGVWNFKLSLAFIRAETNGTESARAFDGVLRAARKLTPRLEAYGQGAYRENKFAGIDHQWAGELGLAYQFLNADPHSLKLEAGFGYTKERRLQPAPPAGPGGTEDRNFSTARAGLEYKWKISKTAEFSEEASYTRDLKDSSDWRFADKVSLSAGVTTVLSVKLSYAWLTLNEPVPGKKKTDTITSAALVAKF